MNGKKGRLRLKLTDVYGQYLSELVDIYFYHQTLSEKVAARAVDASKPVVVSGLRTAPQGLYRVFIDPPSFLPVHVFLNVGAGPVTERALVFPVDPQKVTAVEFPKWEQIDYAHRLLEASNRVLGYEELNGAQLYERLDDLRRAGMLNIFAKSRRTRLSSGKTVFEYILELRELRGDRFFARVPHQLREDVKNSVPEGLFSEVSGFLHRPPDGYSHAGSFKTPDSYGNLHLTFFASAMDWVADMDIDDAGGLEHLFQVARNALTGRPTHPYDIHEILIRYQEIDPEYRLVVRG